MRFALWNAPLDRSKAWSCLAANLLAAPGLGSLMAKRRAGWPQILMSVLGAILIISGMVTLTMHWIAVQQLPADMGDYLWLLMGIVLFGTAWLWSLLTSLSILRQTKQPPVHSPQR